MFGFVAHVLLIKWLPQKKHQKGFIASILAPSLPRFFFFFFFFFLSRAHTLSKIGHRFALGKGWLIFQQKLILLNWKNENNFKVKFGVPLTSQLSKYAQKSNKRIILKQRTIEKKVFLNTFLSPFANSSQAHFKNDQNR